jgi:ABC-type enterochelin transport system permease subunit
LTSVGILTTGFDEPTVDTIILIRPQNHWLYITKWLVVVQENYQDMFTVIDLGNNAAWFDCGVNL